MPITQYKVAIAVTIKVTVRIIHTQYNKILRGWDFFL